LKKLHVAAFVAALFVVAGIAPSFADGKAVNVAAVKATTVSGTATLATSGTQVADAMANFGTPPSGEIPILFNDHHVYAKPDELKQNRVLAALVKGNTIFVPLRSMFEQMGATVSWNAASKTATAQKPGASVQVTVGKNEAVINGEARPLDVPPEIYKGVVVVPVRVMSESLGAYVQWVPDRRICVVRYIPPTPIPTPPPTAPPTAPPTLAPTPSPTPAPYVYRGFLQGGLTAGKVYDAYAAGQKDVGKSYVAAGAYLSGKFAFKADFRQDTYSTTVNGVLPADNTGFPFPDVVCDPSAQDTGFGVPVGAPVTFFSTLDGGTCFISPTQQRASTIDGRVEYQIWKPYYYIGLGYIQAANNYGDPALRGVGVGLEALPKLNNPGGLSLFGSFFDYPQAQGTYTVTDNESPNLGNQQRLRYNIMKYDGGVSYSFGHSPFYIYGGFSGDRMTGQSNTLVSGVASVALPKPFNQSHSGPYLGLGFKF
jgi:Copper amine oxidase N-terminal domain